MSFSSTTGIAATVTNLQLCYWWVLLSSGLTRCSSFAGASALSVEQSQRLSCYLCFIISLRNVAVIPEICVAYEE